MGVLHPMRNNDQRIVYFNQIHKPVIMKTIIACTFLGMALLLGSGCQEKTAEPATAETPVAAPAGQADPAELVRQGGYLVQIMGCSDCHTPLKMTPQGPAPDMDHFLAGHPNQVPLPPVNDPEIKKSYVLFNMTNTAITGPWGTSFTANLTPHDTGIGSWTEEQFMRAMREGKSKGMENARPLLPPMPWQNYTNMKEEDLKAIFAYLKSIQPIDNAVPAAILAAAPPQ